MWAREYDQLGRLLGALTEDPRSSADAMSIMKSTSGMKRVPAFKVSVSLGTWEPTSGLVLLPESATIRELTIETGSVTVFGLHLWATRFRGRVVLDPERGDSQMAVPGGALGISVTMRPVGPMVTERAEWWRWGLYHLVGRPIARVQCLLDRLRGDAVAGCP